MNSTFKGGMCRCCASEGTYKDIDSAYQWMGENEIYSAMLKDCFDISLSSADTVMSGICELCITQLRNSSNFKKQVQQTEEHFKKLIENKHLFQEVKLEDVGLDLNDDINADTGTDDFIDLADFGDTKEVSVKFEVAEGRPKRRAAEASTSQTKKKKKKVIKIDPEKSTQQEDHLQCNVCKKRFSKSQNLQRHISEIHNVQVKLTKKKLCHGCGRKFFNDKNLSKHLAIGCPASCIRQCPNCSMSFETTSGMFIHMRRHHWTEDTFRNLQCHLCGHVFETHIEHDKHLIGVHDLELEYQEYIFGDWLEFEKWKRGLDDENVKIFVEGTSEVKTKYYRCFPIQSLGERKPKDNICPARIETNEESGVIYVQYQSIHMCVFSKETSEKVDAFCPLCPSKFRKMGELNDHLSSSHKVEIEIEKLTFNDFDGSEGEKRGKRRKKKSDESATPERVEHRTNLTAILQYSNASPFRDKTMKGFSCLYCCKYFKNIADLRTHTAQLSEKNKINKMIDYKLSYNPIKVDITNLRCTVCDMEMTDLNDLKDHLITAHDKVIHREIKDIILPFRLEDGLNYTCVICSDRHISFKNLYHHMSSHYRNYCCNKCGAGYITVAALRKHGKTHEQGHFPCDFCDKFYTSLTKKRNHEKGVHTLGWLRNKCPHCPEIFVSYYDRSEHLVKVHNETPIVYSCNACNKIYKKKFELNRHIRHHHLQQRSYLCDNCNAQFFSKRGLTDHMSRHYGGEVFKCDVCGKSFSRERTLRQHLKMHNEDDKKFQCEICKKTFTAKCSLKSHMKLHQDDLDIFKEFDDVKHLIDNRELTLKEIAAENKRKSSADARRDMMLKYD